MKKVFLSIKFYEDFRNKEIIENLTTVLENLGFEVVVVAKDYEKFGKVSFSPSELMKLTFSLIDDSSLVIVEFSEKGVGLGIEAGYAHAKNIPIIVIAKNGSDISSTLQGIASEIIFYDETIELEDKLKKWQ